MLNVFLGTMVVILVLLLSFAAAQVFVGLKDRDHDCLWRAAFALFAVACLGTFTRAVLEIARL